MCFGVSVGFCWVLFGHKCNWDWIVGFGEDQVSFACFSWELLSFFFFFSYDSFLVWCVFDVFWGLRCVFVGFLLVIVLEKCKLWFLENIGKA